MKTLKEKHKELCELIGEQEAIKKLHEFYNRAIRKARTKREMGQISDKIIEIVEHLNMVTGYHYRIHNPETIKLIKARLKDKFSVEDFKKVHIIKAKQWKNSDMRRYLRPVTLYRASKFEGYLQEYYEAKKEEEKRKARKEKILKRIEEENQRKLKEIKEGLANAKRF